MYDKGTKSVTVSGKELVTREIDHIFNTYPDVKRSDSDDQAPGQGGATSSVIAELVQIVERKTKSVFDKKLTLQDWIEKVYKPEIATAVDNTS